MSKIPLMESYYTIQGEGFHTGKAAYFVRLGGCDVGCHWCDVKESWDASKHPLVSIKKIASEASNYPTKIVVITGGEPLMYNLDELCKALRNKGFKAHIETSGAYSLSGKWDWICLSPKKIKPPLQEILRAANELKVIIYNKSDFAWAAQYAKKVNKACKLYLQPEWGKSKKVIPEIVKYVKNNPEWQISLQTHKFLNIP